MELRICKRCLLLEEIPEDVAVYLDRLLDLIPEKERTRDDVYKNRIEVCRSCEKLEGAVCMGCGCYAELRAAAAAQSCPYKKWGKG